MPIAHTRTRLRGYATIRTVPGGAFMADPDQIAANLSSLLIVGAISELTINQERDTNNMRREFNLDLLGKPAETYPGLPKYSVSLKRVDLYDANLYEAFGIAGSNIIDQFKPVVIVVEQPVPTDNNGNPLVVKGQPMKPRTYIMPGGWFDKFPIEFNVEDADQKFVLDTELIVSDVFVA